MSKSGRKPTAHYNPSARKQVAVGRTPSSISEHPSWRFGQIDDEGPFCWRQMMLHDVEQTLERLQSYESMTWGEIESHQSHYLGEAGLEREAIGRLTEMNLEDQIDQIFSLRITSAVRVIGIRRDAVLYLLWWDGTHGAAKSGYRK